MYVHIYIYIYNCINIVVDITIDHGCRASSRTVSAKLHGCEEFPNHMNINVIKGKIIGKEWTRFIRYKKIHHK